MNSAPRSWTMAPIRAISSAFPVRLEAWVQTTARVPGRTRRASSLPVRRNKVQRHAPLRLKAVQRPQDGVMLQIR